MIYLSRGGDDRDEVVEVTLKVGCFSCVCVCARCPSGIN